MMPRTNDFQDDINWDVYKGQQTPVAADKGAAPEGIDASYTDMPIGPQDKMKNVKKIHTGLGDFPDPRDPYFKTDEAKHGNDKLISEMINAVMGGPGMKIAGEVAPVVKGAAGKAWNYLHPEKEAEKFRSELSEGTSKENIENLGKRVEFAKKSAKEEALTPKRELYQQEGKSDVYKIGKENLPEGNLDRVAGMIEEGGKFSEGQMKALAGALKNYRKTGNVDSFMEKGEEIFNVDQIPKKAAEKIEDALLLPTKRESKYFAEEGVTDFYGRRGLKTLHDAYEEKPTLGNYDSLQSAIKKQIRKLEGKGKNLDSAGEEKLEALSTNAKNLNADKEAFAQTLPEKMQNLENDFRTKYAKNVAPYENAPLAIRKLAEGRSAEVTGEQIAKAFTNPTKETLKILQDLGPSAGKNLIYNALQKVAVNDAEGMAKTLLDLKRTKGYDQFITKDMEDWANNMLTHTHRAGLIKKTLGATGGALAGGAMFGPLGAIAGGTAPWLKEGGKYLAAKLRK